MDGADKRKLTIDGVSLAYEEHGEGSPVVFIHGFPASSYSWRRIAQGLACSHRTICFDLMGFGDSDKPRDESYTLRRQAGLIHAAAVELELGGFVVVGHSLGGGVCLSLMRELNADQRLVTGLVLVNTVCYPQRLPWFIKVLRFPVLPELLMKLIPERWGFKALQNAMYHPHNGMGAEAMNEYARGLASPGGHAAVVKIAKQVVPDDVDELVASYAEICVPTLIIWGRQDRVLPLNMGRKLADTIPNAFFCEINCCGHCPQEERPDEVLGMIERFVGSIEASA